MRTNIKPFHSIVYPGLQRKVMSGSIMEEKPCLHTTVPINPWKEQQVGNYIMNLHWFGN